MKKIKKIAIICTVSYIRIKKKDLGFSEEKLCFYLNSLKIKAKDNTYKLEELKKIEISSFLENENSIKNENSMNKIEKIIRENNMNYDGPTSLKDLKGEKKVDFGSGCRKNYRCCEKKENNFYSILSKNKVNFIGKRYEYFFEDKEKIILWNLDKRNGDPVFFMIIII